MNFSELIESKLKEKGWNSAELARKAGVSKWAIRKLLMGRSEPKLETAVKVAKALDMNANEVFRSSDESWQPTDFERRCSDLQNQ